MASRDEGDFERRLKQLEILTISLAFADHAGFSLPEKLINQLLADADESFQEPMIYVSQMIHALSEHHAHRWANFENRLKQLSDRTVELHQSISRIESSRYRESPDSFHDKKITSFYSEEGVEKLSLLLSDLESLRRETYENFIIDSMNVDRKEVAQTRYISVAVYISEEISYHQTQVIEEAFADYLDSLGFIFAIEYSAITESWWKKWIARSKEKVVYEELVDMYKKAKLALELKYIDVPKASIAAQKAKIQQDYLHAAGTFLDRLKDLPDMNVQFGQFVVIKKTTPGGQCNINAYILSEEAAKEIENNPEAIKDTGNLRVIAEDNEERRFGD